MKQPTDNQGLTPEEPNKPSVEHSDSPEALQAALERGAEPYWMQDIRLAQRHLDEQRLRRAVQSSGTSKLVE
jgi:hypothetical protein